MAGGTLRSVVVALRLALAHHPLCSVFEDDVFRVRGVGLCRGCVLAGAGFLLGLPLAILLLGSVSPRALVLGGTMLGLPQLASYVHRASRWVRAGTKLIGGLGLAGLFIGLAASGWPFPILVLLLALVAAAFLALQALRARAILATCRRCPWAADWEHCPGFGGI